MLEKLSKQQEKLMIEVRDEWIDIALYKQNFDKEELEAGVKWMYYASNLKEPKVEFIDSPEDFAKKFLASVGDSVRDSVSYCSLLYDSDDASWMEYWNKIGIYDDKDGKLKKYLGFLKSGAFYCLFFEKVAYIMRRPIRVEQNERKQLHSTKYPAIEYQDGTAIYKLNGVTFEKEWWDKIVNDKMTAQEVLAIDNTEHRRIAYEYMDKTKMKKLKGYKVLDKVKDDGYGNPMKIISFEIPKIGTIKYLNCFCPSSGREYYLGTDKDTCWSAKNSSFGLEDVKWVKEW